MKRSLVLAGILTLVCTIPMQAAVEKGDVELDLNVSYSDRSSANVNPDKELFSAEVGIDRFITHTIQVGAFLDAAWSEQGSALEAKDWGIGARARLHFKPSAKNVPYIGLQAMHRTAEQTIGVIDVKDTGLVWGILAGIRFDLNEKNDLYIEFERRFYGGDFGDTWDDANRLLFGLRHLIN